MYIYAPNGVAETYPYSIGQLRKDNPNTSFPKRPSDELLQEWGVFPVTPTERPEYNRITHDLVEETPELVNGSWVQAWALVAAEADVVAARTEEHAAQLRRDRDNLLAETDWMALSDNTLTAEWATYRQALRDITSHANFPYLTDTDWPVKP